MKIRHSLYSQLRSGSVPFDHQVEFNSHFAVVAHIRDYDTNEEQLLNWLAWESKNQNRPKVMRRLHQRFNKLRAERERRELKIG